MNETLNETGGDVGHKPIVEYGLDAKTFILMWETSDGIDEAHQKMAAFCRAHGHPPVPRTIMIARGAKYRAQGTKLKKFRGGLRPASQTVAEMNDYIAEIRRDQQAGVAPLPPAPPAPRPARPGVDEDEVRRTIKALLAQLAGGAN